VGWPLGWSAGKQPRINQIAVASFLILLNLNLNSGSLFLIYRFLGSSVTVESKLKLKHFQLKRKQTEIVSCFAIIGYKLSKIIARTQNYQETLIGSFNNLKFSIFITANSFLLKF